MRGRKILKFDNINDIGSGFGGSRDLRPFHFPSPSDKYRKVAQPFFLISITNTCIHLRSLVGLRAESVASADRQLILLVKENLTLFYSIRNRPGFSTPTFPPPSLHITLGSSPKWGVLRKRLFIVFPIFIPYHTPVFGLIGLPGSFSLNPRDTIFRFIQMKINPTVRIGSIKGIVQFVSFTQFSDLSIKYTHWGQQ